MRKPVAFCLLAALGLLVAGGRWWAWAQTGPGARLMQPADLEYRGAFRLPDGSAEINWEYSGEAAAYYPGGDPQGPADGHPGSIFGTGHNWNQHTSEISIPAPVISATKNLDELPAAKTLQEFRNIRGNLFGPLEIMRVGLEYLPPQGQQTSGKLYFCWGQHMEEGEKAPTHGWCELDLSNPKTAGTWRVGDFQRYVTCDYLFEIPKAWADANTPGMYLATGRFRDGGQGSEGPVIIAIAPWNDGNPPAPGAQLKAIPLLMYTDVTAEEQHRMNNYHHADEWPGGAWLTAGEKSAVIFVGTKGQGKCWYGFANGVVWPENGPFPPIPAPPNDSRGWWSSEFVGQILFYNPDDLAAVAKGQKRPNDPQPYATLDVDKCLYGVKSKQQKSHLASCCFDRERALLYVFEPRADGDKSLVHVWKVK